jgi:hypothetical protein
MLDERPPAARRGPRRRRGVAPALGLLLLAPLVGEYLLGNVSIRALPALLFLVPMYGGGALLIREVTRRTGRGWATMLGLGAAYGLVEAGMFDGSLFSPSYEGLDFTAAYVPALGISAYYSLHFIVGHAVWSMTVPIALVEALVPDRRATPWLGNVGLTITAVAYLLGGLLIRYDSRARGDYHTSAAQLAGTAIVVVALIVVALRIGEKAPASVTAKPAPRLPLVGVGAFAASSLFFATPENWPGVAVAVAVALATTVVAVRLSRRAGWRDSHRLAMAGGALLTYAWGGFVVTSIKGHTDAADLAGNVIFAVGALILLAAATRRTVRPLPGPTPGPVGNASPAADEASGLG